MTAAEALKAIVNDAKPEELPALAGELTRALGAVVERTVGLFSTAAPSAASAPRAGADALLTVEQAAERLGVAPAWLYRHAKGLPFSRKLGHRTLRFDARGLDRWAAARGSA